jgi:lipoprotein-anchoring transpeptidase ErfK/SrfK
MLRVALILVILIFQLFLTDKAIAADIFTREKIITVDTSKQYLTAWQDGKVVMQSIVSTGLSQTPTVKGSFKVYSKIPLHRMVGYSIVNRHYDLPNVPDTLYFYKGYGLHGAYWHNNFGRPMSNGCVNLPLIFADKLFHWAEVGTRVEIY